VQSEQLATQLIAAEKRIKELEEINELMWDRRQGSVWGELP